MRQRNGVHVRAQRDRHALAAAGDAQDDVAAAQTAAHDTVVLLAGKAGAGGEALDGARHLAFAARRRGDAKQLDEESR